MLCLWQYQGIVFGVQNEDELRATIERVKQDRLRGTQRESERRIAAAVIAAQPAAQAPPSYTAVDPSEEMRAMASKMAEMEVQMKAMQEQLKQQSNIGESDQ